MDAPWRIESSSLHCAQRSKPIADDPADVPVDELYRQPVVHSYASGVHGLEGKPGFLSRYHYLWSIDR